MATIPPSSEIRSWAASSISGTQSQSTLPSGVRTSRARWPIATDGETPTPSRSGSSSRSSVVWSAASSSRVVQRWPPQPTYWRSSSQIGQCSGASAVSAVCTAQVTQIQAGTAASSRPPRRVTPSVVEAARLLLVGHGGVEVVEPVDGLAQVCQEQLGHVGAEAVADDDPQHREVLPLGRHRVGRDQPAALAQLPGQVEDAVLGDLRLQREGDDGQVRAVGDDMELGHAGQRSGDVQGDVLAGLLDHPVALAAQPQELEVLQHDLGARAGEVQREGGHVAAQVVDVEHQVLGQELLASPDHPADARVDQAVLVAGGLDGDHPLEPEPQTSSGWMKGATNPPDA